MATNCSQLTLEASDGKFYNTDVADTEQILRLVQTIPSKKAEPFKLWLAKVGYERIEETEDPELAFDRAMQTYLQKGHSKNWINQRLKTIEVRKELTEWKRVGIEKRTDSQKRHTLTLRSESVSVSGRPPPYKDTPTFMPRKHSFLAS